MNAVNHNHEFWDCPVIGCPACIAEVKLDQDVEAAHWRELPRRHPMSRRHVTLMTFVRMFGRHGLDNSPFMNVHDWLEEWAGDDEQAYLDGLAAISFARAHRERSIRAIAAGIQNGVE